MNPAQTNKRISWLRRSGVLFVLLIALSSFNIIWMSPKTSAANPAEWCEKSYGGTPDRSLVARCISGEIDLDFNAIGMSYCTDKYSSNSDNLRGCTEVVNGVKDSSGGVIAGGYYSMSALSRGDGPRDKFCGGDGSGIGQITGSSAACRETWDYLRVVDSDIKAWEDREKSLNGGGIGENPDDTGRAASLGTRQECEAEGFLWNPDTNTCSAGSNSSGGTSTAIDCNVDGIGWFVCPVMRVMSDVMDGAFNFISRSFLIIDNDLFDPPTDTYWGVFRNIANALFVLAFIIIIASQISNIGISNYGIKKLLPKLIIVAILVNLSFSLCKIAVDLSNIGGMAANNIFGADLMAESINTEKIDRGNGPNYLSGGVTIAVLGLTAGAGLWIALPLLGGVLLSGLLAVLSAILILSIREIIVLLLVVVSPLAIAATLLPNTQKLFDKWKSLFMGMLIVYPVIGLIWGASNATATILSSRSVQGQGVDGWLNQILALAVMAIPLFATIPVVKGSMNALGKLGGKLNDMGGKFKTAADNRYKDSRMGKQSAYMQQQRSQKRALSQAGQGKGPMSALHKRWNERPGNDFGRQLASTGVYAADEEETKEVNQRVALLNSGFKNGRDVEEAAEALETATKNGDVIGARAAAQILAKGTGQKGKKQLRKTMADMQKEGGALKTGSAVNSGLKKEIGRAGIKGDDAVLDRFSVSQDGADKIEDIEKDASVHANLAIPALLNQRPDDIGLARISGGLDQNTAQRILESDAGKELDRTRYAEVERAAMGDRGDLPTEKWLEQRPEQPKPKRAE